MRPISFSPEREIFRNRFLRLYSVEADFGDFTREYFVCDKGQRAGVVLIRDGEVLLVRQYRYLIDDMSWELPGGGINEGEAPEQAAVRECREEAGVGCASVTPLFQFQQGIDTTRSPAFLFECSDFVVLPDLDNDETDERKWVPLEQALEMALRGDIHDSMTIVGLLAYSFLRARR